MYDRNDLPLGFGFALAEHPQAMKKFSDMDDSQRAGYLNRAHNVSSKREMQNLIKEIEGIV